MASMLLLFISALVSVAASDDTNRLVQKWADCFTRYSLSHATTPRPPRAIAEQAMAKCLKQEDRYERSLKADIMTQLDERSASKEATRSVLGTKTWMLERQVKQIEQMRAATSRRR